MTFFLLNDIFAYISGVPTLSRTDPSQQYGILSDTTSLTCSDPSFSASDSYKIRKNGGIIFDETTTARTKYIPTVTNGKIVLQILSLDPTDEGDYLCVIDFLSSPVLHYELEGRKECLELFKNNQKKCQASSF